MNSIFDEELNNETIVDGDFKDLIIQGNDINKCSIINSDFQKCNFSGLNICDTEFSNCDLSNAFFDNVGIHNCKFNNCMHINEKECKVKDAVENQQILLSRYENYKSFVKRK